MLSLSYLLDRGFPLQNSPKTLNLSYKLELDYLECFRRGKKNYFRGAMNGQMDTDGIG